MRLWHLRGRLDEGPWNTLKDNVVGFIVRAEDEEQARRLARDEAGGEDGYVWMESQFSTCTELLAAGDAAVVMADLVRPQADGFDAKTQDATIRK